MKFDRLLLLQRPDDEEDVARPDAETGDVVGLLRQVEDIELGLAVETDIVPPAEVDLDPALGRADAVAFADGHVERRLLIAEVGGPLHESLALDEAQAGDGLVGILRVLCLLRGLRGGGLRSRGLRLLGEDAHSENENGECDNECPSHDPYSYS